MELREYWGILWQRRWIIAGVTLLAILSSLLFSWQFAAPYKATVRLAVKPLMEQRTDKYYNYDEYYAYVASELLVDDVIEVMESGAILGDLREKLQGRVSDSSLSALDAKGGKGPIEAKKAHRLMTVDVTLPSRADALLIAQTISELLTEAGSKYFTRLSSLNPDVQVVDPPTAVQVGESRRALDLALRAVLGLLAGVGVAFLLDYMNDTIRGAAQAESTTGLPVLGEIPQETRRMRRRRAEPQSSPKESTGARGLA